MPIFLFAGPPWWPKASPYLTAHKQQMVQFRMVQYLKESPGQVLWLIRSLPLVSTQTASTPLMPIRSQAHNFLLRHSRPCRHCHPWHHRLALAGSQSDCRYQHCQVCISILSLCFRVFSFTLTSTCKQSYIVWSFFALAKFYSAHSKERLVHPTPSPVIFSLFGRVDWI